VADSNVRNVAIALARYDSALIVKAVVRELRAFRALQGTAARPVADAQCP
jgi:hypothetical protein